MKLEMALKNILSKIFPTLSPSQIFFFFFLPGVITKPVFSGSCVHASKIFRLFLTFFQSLFYISPTEFAPLQPLNCITISHLQLLKSQCSWDFFQRIFDPFPDHIKDSNCKLLLMQHLKPASHYWHQILLLLAVLMGVFLSLPQKNYCLFHSSPELLSDIVSSFPNFQICTFA